MVTNIRDSIQLLLDSLHSDGLWVLTDDELEKMAVLALSALSREGHICGGEQRDWPADQCGLCGDGPVQNPRRAGEGEVVVEGYVPACVLGREPEVWTNRHMLAVSEYPLDISDIQVTARISRREVKTATITVNEVAPGIFLGGQKDDVAVYPPPYRSSEVK